MVKEFTYKKIKHTKELLKIIYNMDMENNSAIYSNFKEHLFKVIKKEENLS
jgi:hypothetical protein